MSYEVLARKWRPQSFADLVGQTHVVKALTYALSHQQIHHAYLFTGTRGVGKTSIARIFAKSLNCETNGVSANPCGQCTTCQEITAGKYVDLIEVDAASRTGVEETRELIDSVAYLPSKGRYKVYLIDEVHMFSKSSFNALLKTLEEPPEHVKFILATTDPDKLPITILSRCLQFNLKSLTPVQIRQHLANICRASDIAYDEKALELLAAAGDGSMRDTLSMTDQSIAYGHGELRLNTVTEILGTIQPNDIEAILFAIATNNPNQLSQALHRLDNYEVDARAFLIDIMRRLQRMAWAKEGIVEDISPALLSTVGDIPKPLLHLWYDIAEKALPNLAIAGEPRKAVEMALLRMLAFIPEDWVVRHRTLLETDTQETPESGSDSDINSQPQSQPVQASPVTSHDSLDDAEAQFSALTPEAPQSLPPQAEQTTAPIADMPVDTSPQPVPPPIADSDNWHLSATEPASEPVPSMDDVRAVMQSGRDLPAPKPSAKDAMIDQLDTANRQPDDKVDSAQGAVSSAAAEIPPWEGAQEDANITQPQAEKSIETPETTEDTPPVGESVTAVDKTGVQAKIDKTAHLPSGSNDLSTLAADIATFDWYETLPALGLSDYTRHLASLGILHIAEEENYLKATLDLAPKHELLITEESLQELTQALENQFSVPINLAINLTGVEQLTPHERDKISSEKKQSDLLETFRQEPLTQRVLSAFDGQIVEKTVKPRDDDATE